MTTPASGNTGDCDVTVTNLTVAVSVECETGDSGNATGVGTGGNSGAVTQTAPPGGANGAGDAPGATPGAVGGSAATETEGAKGACDFTSANSSLASVSIDCTTGTVGDAEASAAGGAPGPVGGGQPTTGSGGSPAGSDASAASGSGGNATTLASTGQTGNCVIQLVNIDAAVTVVCVTGSSGDAGGSATGGQSGSATLLAAGPNGVAASNGSGSLATSGSGGNAVAVISSGPTGSCIIILVNVRATVTVLCITGTSGSASGLATGGASGPALVASAPGPGGNSPGGQAVSGSGGGATALVSAGGTGNCAVSLTNTLGRISLVCRTGDSGSAIGQAIGGDSGSALVLLKAPTAPPAVEVSAVRSPFSPGGVASPWAHLAPLDEVEAAPAATAVVPPGAFLPVTGAEAAVPLSLAAGLMLTGGLAVGATRRKRRFVRNW